MRYKLAAKTEAVLKTLTYLRPRGLKLIQRDVKRMKFIYFSCLGFCSNHLVLLKHRIFYLSSLKKPL